MVGCHFFKVVRVIHANEFQNSVAKRVNMVTMSCRGCRHRYHTFGLVAILFLGKGSKFSTCFSGLARSSADLRSSEVVILADIVCTTTAICRDSKPFLHKRPRYDGHCRRSPIVLPLYSTRDCPIYVDSPNSKVLSEPHRALELLTWLHKGHHC